MHHDTHPDAVASNDALGREFKALQRAFAKAEIDRERAIKNVLRIYRTLDALPSASRAA